MNRLAYFRTINQHEGMELRDKEVRQRTQAYQTTDNVTSSKEYINICFLF